MTLLKKTWIGFSLLIFYSHSATCQNSNNLIHHTGQYKLTIPEEWMKPKIIRVVTDVLAQTIDELKARDFCTDGTASYYVLLIVDSLTLHQRSYSFYAALRTFDSTGKVLADLRLVSSEEDFDAKENVITNSSVYQTPGREYEIFDDLGTVVATIPTFLPPTIIENSSLTFLELSIIQICRSKLFEIKKMLRKINSM